MSKWCFQNNDIIPFRIHCVLPLRRTNITQPLDRSIRVVANDPALRERERAMTTMDGVCPANRQSTLFDRRRNVFRLAEPKIRYESSL